MEYKDVKSITLNVIYLANRKCQVSIVLNFFAENEAYALYQ